MMSCVCFNEFVRRLVVPFGFMVIVSLTAPSQAWQAMPDVAMFPTVVSDTGAGSNPRIIKTQLEHNALKAHRFVSLNNSADNRDANGIGDKWSESGNGDIDTISWRLFPKDPWTAISYSGNHMYSYEQLDYAENAFIEHRENEFTMGSHVTDIAGTLIPRFNATRKIVGARQLDGLDTDDASLIDTYEYELMQDYEDEDWKTGYEIFRTIHPEGIELTTTSGSIPTQFTSPNSYRCNTQQWAGHPTQTSSFPNRPMQV